MFKHGNTKAQQFKPQHHFQVRSSCLISMWFPFLILCLSEQHIQPTASFLIQLFKQLTNRLTNFMGLSPSWEAASCAPIQELCRILWNPKVQYHVHTSPPLVPILIYMNPVHINPFYPSKIHFNVIHPPTSWSS
jgi:hypothetical protein